MLLKLYFDAAGNSADPDTALFELVSAGLIRFTN